MTTIVTVPGASGTYIPNPYSTPYNIAVAQQISSLLFSANASGTLFVQNINQNPAPVPTGYVGQIAATVPGGGAIAVPEGYSYTAVDDSVTGPVTVSGGGSLFSGNTNVTYYGTPAPAPVLLTAGNGANLLSLPDGSDYQAALGNGNDTVFANGTGTVTGGSGANIVFVGSSNGPNTVNSYGAADTIVAGQGSVTVSSYGADPMLFGGSGQLVYFGSASGSPTIGGGAGTETLFGGSGQNLTYTDGSNTVPGANILAAGAGNESLNAGGAQYGVLLAAGSGADSLVGSTGADTFFGGDGTATMTGNGGADAFIFGNTAGHIGGTDIITDFNSGDVFVTAGYGANAAQTALNAATIAGGNATVTLADNTTITFLDLTNTAGIRSQSF